MRVHSSACACAYGAFERVCVRVRSCDIMRFHLHAFACVILHSIF